MLIFLLAASAEVELLPHPSPDIFALTTHQSQLLDPSQCLDWTIQDLRIVCSRLWDNNAHLQRAYRVLRLKYEKSLLKTVRVCRSYSIRLRHLENNMRLLDSIRTSSRLKRGQSRILPSNPKFKVKGRNARVTSVKGKAQRKLK